MEVMCTITQNHNIRAGDGADDTTNIYNAMKELDSLRIDYPDHYNRGLSCNSLRCLLDSDCGLISEDEPVGNEVWSKARVSDLLPFMEKYPGRKAFGFVFEDDNKKITHVRLMGVFWDKAVTPQMQKDYQLAMGYDDDVSGWYYYSSEDYLESEALYEAEMKDASDLDL